MNKTLNMKQFILVITFLLGISQSDAQYRVPVNRNIPTKFVIKNNVLGYFIDTYNFSFEHLIASQQSVQLVLKIIDQDDSLENKFGTCNEDIKTTKGFSLGGEYRLYFEKRKNDLRGVYFSPYLRYFYQKKSIAPGAYTDAPVGNTYFKRDIFSSGVMFGVQSLRNDSDFGSDFFIGIGYRKKMDRDFSGDITLYKEEDNKEKMSFIEIRFGFNIVMSNTFFY